MKSLEAAKKPKIPVQSTGVQRTADYELSLLWRTRDRVDDLISSQAGAIQTRRILLNISRNTGIRQLSVGHFIYDLFRATHPPKGKQRTSLSLSLSLSVLTQGRIQSLSLGGSPCRAPLPSPPHSPHSSPPSLPCPFPFLSSLPLPSP